MTKKSKKKGKLRLVKIFLTTFIAIIAVFAVAIGALAYVLDRLNEDDIFAVGQDVITGLRTSGGVGDIFAALPEETTFLILGLDDDPSGARRADFMMLGFYNSVTGAVDLISLPRDTRAVVPQYRFDMFRWRPRSTTVRLGEIYNYAGDDAAGVVLTVAQIEEMTGVSIDYYIRVDVAGFRTLVDEIGGVEFYVPQRMFYTDPYQNLVIDLHPGLQTLNGEQAEGLVRFRSADRRNPQGSVGYAMGDLRRVEVQQDFMVAAMSQVITSSRSVPGLIAIANVGLEHVRTNFPVTHVPRYAGEIFRLDMENVNTHTLPGTATNVSPWFYEPNSEGIIALITEIRS